MCRTRISRAAHVTCGGIIYQGDAYPKEYQDQYIAGNLLSNAVYWHKLTPKGSSFTAEHGGDLLVANDTWFRPVDCFQGPDGSVYVADWYDNALHTSTRSTTGTRPTRRFTRSSTRARSNPSHLTCARRPRPSWSSC